MGDFITTYFVSIKVIPGGIRLDLGYAMIVLLFWICSLVIPKVYRGLFPKKTVE
jgi:hypothetical protein